MKKAIIALGLVIVMLLGTAYVYAQDPGADPRHGGMHGQWGRLNLTPEQKTKFQELRRRFIAENAQLIGAVIAKKLELKSLWTDPKADSQAILAKEKELRALQNQMKDKIVQYRLEARSSLTPEQIEKLGLMGGMGRRGAMGHSWGMSRSGMWQ
jgi:Spy/CpxP family protein refolding chaperone